MSRPCPWAWCGTNTPGADLCDLCALTAERDRLLRRVSELEARCMNYERAAEEWIAERDRLREALEESNRILGAMVRDKSFFEALASEALRERIRAAHDTNRAALSRTEADG